MKTPEKCRISALKQHRHSKRGNRSDEGQAIWLMCARDFMTCSTSIRVVHPTEDLSWITVSTGLQPELVHTAGETYRSDGGKEFTRKKSVWIAKIDGDDDDLSAQLLCAISTIHKHAELFARVRTQGGHIDLFAGLFPDGQFGFTLSSELLKALALLNVDFHCTAYGWDRQTSALADRSE